MGEGCIHVGIVDESQSLDKLASMIWNCGADIGALGVYVGRVKGEAVRLVVNVVDENALLDELREYAVQALARWRGLRGVVLYVHRGTLPPGHPIVYILVAGVDRDSVFEALRWLVERYKSARFIEKREELLGEAINEGSRFSNSQKHLH